MSQLITLEHFQAAHRHYHIYRINGSELSHHDHYHNYFQVCYVVCGEIVHRQEGESVHLGPGDAFIIPPGFRHSLHFESVYSEMYSLVFEERLFHAGFARSNAYRFLTGLQAGSTLSGQGIRLRVVLDESQRASVLSLMDCLLRQQEADCPTELSAAPSLISGVVYLLAQSYYCQPQNASELDKLKSYNNTLHQCTQYIDSHYKEKISLADLTKRFGISRSAFCAVFQQFTGSSLHRYIAQKRIMEAQLLIRAHPDRSLNEIAAEVGYEDMTTFYRNFLRVAGVAPAKYRELCVSGEHVVKIRKKGLQN